MRSMKPVQLAKPKRCTATPPSSSDYSSTSPIDGVPIMGEHFIMDYKSAPHIYIALSWSLQFHDVTQKELRSPAGRNEILHGVGQHGRTTSSLCTSSCQPYLRNIISSGQHTYNLTIHRKAFRSTKCISWLPATSHVNRRVPRDAQHPRFGRKTGI